MKRLHRKRTLVVLALFIAGGAIVNVAVAWVCAARGQGRMNGPDSAHVVYPFFGWEPELGPSPEGGPRPTEWVAPAPPSWKFPTQYLAWHFTGYGEVRMTHYSVKPPTADDFAILMINAVDWRMRRTPSLPAPKTLPEIHEMIVRKAGWPFASVQSTWLIPSSDDPRRDPRDGFATEIQIPRQWLLLSSRNWPENKVILPIVPLWFGLLGNALAYGTTIWILSTALLMWLRYIRIKRGKCPACAYKIGASPVCTECGSPVLPLTDAAPPPTVAK